MELHHVGIATREGGSLAGTFADLFGVDLAHEEVHDGIWVGFLDLGRSYLELLEPREGGTVDDYLRREGSGIHHVAVETDDAAGALDRARELGIEPVDESPRPGAWGHDVAFLHPRDTGGVLVEFVETGDH